MNGREVNPVDFTREPNATTVVLRQDHPELLLQNPPDAAEQYTIRVHTDDESESRQDTDTSKFHTRSSTIQYAEYASPPPHIKAALRKDRCLFCESPSQAVIIAFYCFISISLTVTNKWLLTEKSFEYPITVVLCHCITGSISVWVLMHYWFREEYSTLDMYPTNIDRTTFTYTILPPAILYSLHIIFTFVGLMLASVTLYSIIASVVPVAMFGAYVCFGLDKMTWQKCTVMIVIAAGVALTARGDSNLNVFALFFFAAAVTCFVFATIYIQLLTGTGGWGLPPLLVTFYILAVGVPLTFFSAATLEWHNLFVSEFVGVEEMIQYSFYIFITCGLAVGVNISRILLIAVTNAVTTSVVVIVETILLITVSQVIFEPDLNGVRIVGILIAMSGVAIYSYIKILEGKKSEEFWEEIKNTKQGFEMTPSPSPFGGARSGAFSTSRFSASSTPFYFKHSGSNFFDSSPSTTSYSYRFQSTMSERL